MKKEYKIKLFRGLIFDHNVYIRCEKIEKTSFCTVVVDDDIKIDFILEIGSIEENK